MGGHRRCEVCGIKEAWQTGNKLLFSNFPLDPNRCREWLKAVGNEELVHLPIEKLHQQRNVCAKHFEKKHFNKKGNRLKRHAIPTLHLMALPLTDSQLVEFPQHVYSEPKEVFEDPKNKEELSGKSTCETMPKQVGIGESVPASSSQDYPMVSIPEDFETMETYLTEMEQPIVYVTGYIPSVILKNQKCQNFEKCLKIEDPYDDFMFIYIKLREWWPEKLSLKKPV